MFLTFYHPCIQPPNNLFWSCRTTYYQVELSHTFSQHLFEHSWYLWWLHRKKDSISWIPSSKFVWWRCYSDVITRPLLRYKIDICFVSLYYDHKVCYTWFFYLNNLNKPFPTDCFIFYRSNTRALYFDDRHAQKRQQLSPQNQLNRVQPHDRWDLKFSFLIPPLSLILDSFSCCS